MSKRGITATILICWGVLFASVQLLIMLPQFGVEPGDVSPIVGFFYVIVLYAFFYFSERKSKTTNTYSVTESDQDWVNNCK